MFRNDVWMKAWKGRLPTKGSISQESLVVKKIPGVTHWSWKPLDDTWHDRETTIPLSQQDHIWYIYIYNCTYIFGWLHMASANPFCLVTLDLVIYTKHVFSLGMLYHNSWDVAFFPHTFAFVLLVNILGHGPFGQDPVFDDPIISFRLYLNMFTTCQHPTHARSSRVERRLMSSSSCTSPDCETRSKRVRLARWWSSLGDPVLRKISPYMSLQIQTPQNRPPPKLNWYWYFGKVWFWSQLLTLYTFETTMYKFP